MNNKLRKYLTIQFEVSTPLGKRLICINQNELEACLDNDEFLHKSNEVLKQAGSPVRICVSVEKEDSTWDNFVI